MGDLLSSLSVRYGQGNVSGESQRYAFDITALAQKWANGTASPSILPEDTKYIIVVDVRGQDWKQNNLDSIEQQIEQRSNYNIEVNFIK